MGQPEYRDVIERALERELAARRELNPHAQLAIPPNATPAAVEDAYAQLRVRYDSGAFAAYGSTAVAAAEGIGELLVRAYESMRRRDGADGSEPKPLPTLKPAVHRDETCRALETLRGAIERRVAEAQAHRSAGRRDDAIRVFESVRVLDRQNVHAHQALRELRAEVAPRRASTWSRMLGRVFGRRASEASVRDRA